MTRSACTTEQPEPGLPEDSYPLSELQHGMLLHSLSAPDEGVYLLQKHLTLREDLDVAALGRALRWLVAQHPVLRTSFQLDTPDRPSQSVAPEVSIMVAEYDWRGHDLDARRDLLRDFLARDKYQPFDLAAGPPMRFSLFRTGDHEYEFVWTSHHALMDGRSAVVLLTELFQSYEAMVAGRRPDPPARRPYADYISWLGGQDLGAAEVFWRKHLATLLPPRPLLLETDRVLAPGEEVYAKTVLEVSEDVTSAMMALGREHHVTVNNFVQGAWALLLHGHRGQRDVVFGATRAGRSFPDGVGDMVGLFINTLPFRVTIDDQQNVLTFLEHLRENNTTLREFEHTPLTRIHACSGFPPQTPLFDSVVIFENFVIDDLLSGQGGGWANREFHYEDQVSYPLALNAYRGSRLILKLSYDRRRFTGDAADVLLDHLRQLLEAMVGGVHTRLGELPVFGTPAARARAHEEFWAERLADLAPLHVPHGESAPSPPADHYELELATPADVLAAFADDPARSLFTAYIAFLARFSDSDKGFDIGLRSPASAPSIPLRAPALCANDGFREYHRKMLSELATVETHESYPRDLCLRHPRLRDRGFDITGGLPITVELAADLDTPAVPDPGTALLIRITPRGDRCRWIVADTVLKRRAAENLCAQFQTFLFATADPAFPDLSTFPMLSELDRRLLDDWNNTATDYPRNQCAHQLITARARQRPDAPAVTFDGSTLTYRELDTLSSQLAAFLLGQGVGPGSLVGVLLDRSADLVVSLLAVWKAGAAYVPLDPIYPHERIAFMLADAHRPVLLTHSRHAAGFRGLTSTVVALDQQWPQIIATGNEHVDLASAEQPAYVIYTSGTSGQPKGVRVGHRALTNFLCSMAKTPGFSEHDRLLAVTTICFDIAGLELFLPLITGGQVELAAAAVASDGFALLEVLQRSRPTVVQATPATWRMLITAGWTGDARLTVLCGGEVLARDLADELHVRARAVWNLYGPTETTIWSAVDMVERGRRISIGRPIANTRFQVLDNRARPVPPGEIGELYIGGDGLASGYHARPELTREKFIPCLPGRGEGRLYRTGDLVRHLPDGRLEYLGRKDNQVKLRGYRIELTEIEHALRSHPTVGEAAVVLHEDSPGDHRLVAYVVPVDPHATVATDELHQRMREILPDYMIPSAFIALERIPLTLNGKVNRGALPKPPRPGTSPTYVPPSSAAERTVATIWREVLGLDRVGADDNFFEAGGNSLSLMSVVKRLKEEFDDSLTRVDMFQYPTVRSMASRLELPSCPGDGTAAAVRAQRAVAAVNDFRRARLAVRRRDSAG